MQNAKLKEMFQFMSDTDIAKWIIFNTRGEGIVARQYPRGELSLLSAVIGYTRLQAPENEKDFVFVRTVLMCCPLSREFRDNPEFKTAADDLFAELDDGVVTGRDLYENPNRLVVYRYRKYKWYEPDAQNMIAVSCIDRIDQLTEKTIDDCCDFFPDTEGFRKNAGGFDFLNNSEYV